MSCCLENTFHILNNYINNFIFQNDMDKIDYNLSYQTIKKQCNEVYPNTNFDDFNIDDLIINFLVISDISTRDRDRLFVYIYNIFDIEQCSNLKGCPPIESTILYNEFIINNNLPNEGEFFSIGINICGVLYFKNNFECLDDTADWNGIINQAEFLSIIYKGI